VDGFSCLFRAEEKTPRKQLDTRYRLVDEDKPVLYVWYKSRTFGLYFKIKDTAVWWRESWDSSSHAIKLTLLSKATYNHDSYNSGLSALLKDTSTRAKDVPSSRWPTVEPLHQSVYILTLIYDHEIWAVKEYDCTKKMWCWHFNKKVFYQPRITMAECLNATWITVWSIRYQWNQWQLITINETSGN